jgi:hypothetical protein
MSKILITKLLEMPLTTALIVERVDADGKIIDFQEIEHDKLAFVRHHDRNYISVCRLMPEDWVPIDPAAFAELSEEHY